MIPQYTGRQKMALLNHNPDGLEIVSGIILFVRNTARDQNTRRRGEAMNWALRPSRYEA
jgi:hypothetical protein